MQPTKPSIKWLIVIFGLLTIFVSVYVFVFLDKKPESAPVDVVTGVQAPEPKYQIVGKSVQGRKIEGYTFGATPTSTSPTHLLFVGGIHGGYEWNSVLLAYELIDYLEANPIELPDNLIVTIIPVLNPDGVFSVTGKEGRFISADASKDQKILAGGRFNANNVDLNRNFDCNWQPTSSWRSKTVSAGSAVFSEPEALGLKNFVDSNTPTAVIFWHSQSNAVYASKCNGDTLPQTLDIMNAYAKAAGYSAIESFDAYPITGDAEGWLASIGIPAITVEMKTHEDVEWKRNLAGVKSLFDYYSSSTL
jgi:hypothetical protein